MEQASLAANENLCVPVRPLLASSAQGISAHSPPRSSGVQANSHWMPAFLVYKELLIESNINNVRLHTVKAE